MRPRAALLALLLVTLAFGALTYRAGERAHPRVELVPTAAGAP